jgi:hypothetical protein
VLEWLGLSLMFPHSLQSLLNFLAGVPGSKQMRQELIWICSAVIWALWRHKNLIVFEDGNGSVAGLVDEVKNSILEMVDWTIECFSVLFYEWTSELMLCLARWRCRACSNIQSHIKFLQLCASLAAIVLMSAMDFFPPTSLFIVISRLLVPLVLSFSLISIF